jgi:hypothetical protein
MEGGHVIKFIPLHSYLNEVSNDIIFLASDTCIWLNLWSKLEHAPRRHMHWNRGSTSGTT